MSNQRILDIIVNSKQEIAKLNASNPHLTQFHHDIELVDCHWCFHDKDTILYLEDGSPENMVCIMDIVHKDERYLVVEAEDGDGYQVSQYLFLMEKEHTYVNYVDAYYAQEECSTPNVTSNTGCLGAKLFSELNYVTAICEMQDQAVCIEDIRIIENKPERFVRYEAEMEEMMGMMGYSITYYSKVIDLRLLSGSYGNMEEQVYQWMRDNADSEISVGDANDHN